MGSAGRLNIGHALLQLHPNLFPTLADASHHVAEVPTDSDIHSRVSMRTIPERLLFFLGGLRPPSRRDSRTSCLRAKKCLVRRGPRATRGRRTALRRTPNHFGVDQRILTIRRIYAGHPQFDKVEQRHLRLSGLTGLADICERDDDDLRAGGWNLSR